MNNISNNHNFNPKTKKRKLDNITNNNIVIYPYNLNQINILDIHKISQQEYNITIDIEKLFKLEK